MTPQQKSLLATARRFGLSASLLVAVGSWGFKQYDATNASAIETRARIDSVVARRTLDSLRAAYEADKLYRQLLRTDSAVRRVCIAIRVGC